MGSCWTRLFLETMSSAEPAEPSESAEYTKIVYKDTDFDRWNEESVAATFIRLMTKNNFPFNKNMLTEKEFNYEYDLLESYIKWCETAGKIPTSYCYDFTVKNMYYFLGLIKYDMEDRGSLVIKWKKLMYRF